MALLPRQKVVAAVREKHICNEDYCKKHHETLDRNTGDEEATTRNMQRVGD
jgi:hypothetical protein